MLTTVAFIGLSGVVLLRYSSGAGVPEQQQQETISGVVDFHEIVRLVLRIPPEVPVLTKKFGI
jgi:hypothetical protein